MSKNGTDDKAKLRLDTRAGWIGVLSRANRQHLLDLWLTTALRPDYETLRPPEIGLVMTRGRAGADGAPFNLGEATVTRCAVRLDDGSEGHAYVLGRDKEKALVAALCDALMQTEAAETVRRAILLPLHDASEARQAETARKAAETKVEFFTMTRGEDA